MTRRIAMMMPSIGLLCLFASFPHGTLADDLQASKAAPKESVFGLTKLHQIQFQSRRRITRLWTRRWRIPTRLRRSAGWWSRPNRARSPRCSRASTARRHARPGALASNSSTFTPARQVDDNIKDVGVRYKGNATYMMSSRWRSDRSRSTSTASRRAASLAGR